MKLLLGICFIFLSNSLLYAEQISSETISPPKNNVREGVVISQSTLTEKPSNQSTAIEMLSENQKVNVLKRERAWYQISTQQEVFGWINMLNIRFINTAKREGELGIGSLFNSANKDTLPTVSTGIRGFDEEDLKKATPDIAQVELLNLYAITAPEAKTFAEEGALVEQSIAINEEEEK